MSRGVGRAGAFVLALTAVPELADAELGQRAGETGEVVGVRVGEHRDVDARSAPCAQERQNHRLSGVDGATDEAAAVDEHQLAVGQIDQRAVALPDVRRW